jgi:uncharacterized damage-inducible protein DinB
MQGMSSAGTPAMGNPSPIVRKAWFTRTFTFDLEPWMMPNVIERLRGTHARLAERLAGLPGEVLTRGPAPGKWSIQENVGHLLDLETLWMARLSESLAGAKGLTAADVTNKKTHEARHGEKDFRRLLDEFRRERARYVAALEPLGEAQVVMGGLHPRLQVPMRIIDQAFFVAEHDDHHLAGIREMLGPRSA